MAMLSQGVYLYPGLRFQSASCHDLPRQWNSVGVLHARLKAKAESPTRHTGWLSEEVHQGISCFPTIIFDPQDDPGKSVYQTSWTSTDFAL